jgi:hypothetical protein
MGRRWGTQLIVIAFPAGLLLYGFFCYRLLMAGGLSAMSIRPTCSVKAAIVEPDLCAHPGGHGIEAVALQLHAADARLLSLESNTATQPARQAAPRPHEVEKQCSPSACIARRQGPI